MLRQSKGGVVSDTFGRPDDAVASGAHAAPGSDLHGRAAPSPAADPGLQQNAIVPEASPLVLAERYVVDRELGRGGMGQVLLAHDRRLNRPVAIKVLPPESCGPRELRRLEQEARIVGALGHPNVVEVHDIGTFDGRPFIVEEFLEGMTLRQRMSEGPLPVPEAIDIATQVARGLAAAHDRGVVHCDIKPANLFVRKDGRVKILDFGVARATDGASAAPETTGSAGVGRFAGTPAYSSPEQIRCAPMDARSDTFSLGCVLYEMLARRRPFEGPTAVEIGYAVLQADPRPLPAAVPADVERIVRRCLEKDPDKRFQSAKDLVFNLEGVAHPPAARRVRWLPWPVTSAIGIALAAATVLVALRERRHTPPSFHQITFLPGAVWTARFSPDGHEVVYTEAFDGMPPRVYTTRVGQPEYHRMDLQDAVLLGVSSRGELALLRKPEFRATDYVGTLATMPFGAAAPRELLERVDYADWAPDGASFAVVRRVGAQQRLEHPIGKVLFETTGWLSHPRVSPHGDLVAFLHHPDPGTQKGAVMVVQNDGKARTLAHEWPDATGLAWSADGSEIWFTASAPDPPGEPIALRAVTLDGAHRLLWQMSGNIKLEDVSRGGTLAVTAPRRYVGMAASNGTDERDLSIRDEQVLQDLSADGSLVLFTVDARARDGDGLLFVRGTDGSFPIQIGAGFGGALSPDRKSALVFPSVLSTRAPSLVPIGPGDPQRVDFGTLAVMSARFFPDGRRVALAGQAKGGATRLYVLALDGGAPRPISDEGVNPWRIAVSPDGRFVAGIDADASVTLYPAEGGKPLVVPESKPGEVPYGWTPDGALLVGRTLEAPVDIYRIDLWTRARSLWKTVRPTAPGAYAVGRIFFAARSDVLAYSYVNWKTHLYLVDGLR